MNRTVPTLPPNTTALERTIAVACAELVNVPVPLRELWNADRCPVALLPFLAWACSVDRWDDNWPESIKRGTIKASYFIVSPRLINLTLTLCRGDESDQLDISLDDSDGKLALPPRGAQIALALG
ncbi:phage tail protein I [Janthinobacterium violaceinigrum]|uniref:Phage tail protein I n=1 Tax=Janthinobacterium violaceinigrum TaxID=2654252 RepID=A0A6I1I488_9BURK|nr:phage tail protein I [Janthinobacterium violaceinigrum]